MISKRVIMDLARTAPYLVRWSMPLPFGWSVKLHLILRPDDDRCAHDHPWSFCRIILLGGYTEEWAATPEEPTVLATRLPWRPWVPWRIYCCGQQFRHRILSLRTDRSWSLVVCGPRCREWGFFTKWGWMRWREFVAAAWSSRVLWCDDGRILDQITDEEQ